MQRSQYHLAVAGGPLAIDTTLRALQGGVNMWNDTDTPLACFISFRTYGTWLHGDTNEDRLIALTTAIDHHIFRPVKNGCATTTTTQSQAIDRESKASQI